MAHNQGGLNGIEAIGGIQPSSTSAIEKIALLNYDSNPTRTTGPNNQTHFLGLTAQYTTTPFNSTSLDIAFNDGGTVGINPFGNPPRTANKMFTIA